MSDSLRYEPNAVSDYVIGVDLGGTNLRAASVRADGVIGAQTRGKTPRTGDVADLVAALVAAVHECAAETVRDGGRVRALALAVPGTIDTRGGLVRKAPNIPGLSGFPLAETLGQAAGVPVVLENDANAAAVGELWQGAARGRRNIVMLTLGTGVGGGVIVEGELLRGSRGAAAELGHITIEPDGYPCPCGSRGCLEVYASATAVERLAREAGLNLGEGGRALTSYAVYEQAMRGDEQARGVFRMMGRFLGTGIASLANVLDPEVFVIGGGVAAGWEAFIEFIRDEVRLRAFSEEGKNVEIVRASCGEDAGVLGAAHLGFKALG